MVKTIVFSLVLLLAFEVGANPAYENEPELKPAVIFFGLYLGGLMAALLSLGEEDGNGAVVEAVEDPFLPELALGAASGKILATLGNAGWAVEISHDRTPLGEHFILEGRRGDRLIRYTYDSAENLAEVVYAEPHPPDETRTEAYGAWLDVLKETFGEPEVSGSFHHWETGVYVVDIGAEDFDFGDGSPAPVVRITIARLP
ncbi:MAG: hypothetical protein NTW26_08075 [bacterium]|nr:hypothetical protein [bacterium]